MTTYETKTEYRVVWTTPPGDDAHDGVDIDPVAFAEHQKEEALEYLRDFSNDCWTGRLQSREVIASNWKDES